MRQLERTFLLITFLAAGLSAAPACQAEMALPQWQIGDWWRIQETVDIEIHAEGFQDGSEITLNDHTKYHITEIAPRTQTRSGQTYNVYVMMFEGAGTMQAEGTFKMAGLTYDVRIINGDQLGEQWNRAEDMCVVMTNRILQGTLEGKGPDGSWRPFGPFRITMFEEYDPPIPYGYPLEVGKRFAYSLQADLFGDYNLTFAGIDITNQFSKTQTWEISCQVPFQENQTGCQYQEASYYIDANHLQDGMPARQQGWVEPRIKWYNKIEISSLQHPLGIVRSAHLCLTDCQVAYQPPQEITVSLNLNQQEFTGGDLFALTSGIGNPGAARDAQLYVALDLSSLGLSEPYYFWPSWVHYPQGVDHQDVSLPAGASEIPVVSFTWPAGAGAAQNLSFLGILLSPDGGVLSNAAQVSFGFR